MNPLLYKIKHKIFNNQKYKIVFYGDSTTSCEWVHPNWREIFEYVLKMNLESVGNGWEFSWWNINFTNAGLNGATTQDFLNRVEVDVLEYKPDLVICLMGDNDVDKISEQEHAENIFKFIEIMQNNVSDFVYSTNIKSGIDYHNSRYKSYIDEIEKGIGKYSDIKYINLFEEVGKRDFNKYFTYEVDPEVEGDLTDEKGGIIDLIHPNSDGNAIIAEILLKHIFDIKFDSALYMKEFREGKKYPAF